ncbi:MAG: hypothetical protein ABFD92_05600 [Planctomycetaceae bacterium]|nr:hypothetical protein [Planctomycetaceae bacterium]
MRSINSIKGYVYLGISVLVLAAAILFVLLQWGNVSRITAYGPAVDVNTLLLVFFSAVGGVVMVLMVRLLRHAVRLLRRSGPPQA